MYRESWLTMRIIDTPSEDMTRAWYRLSTSMDEEGLQNTANSLIHIGKPIQMDYDGFLAKIDAFYDYVKDEPDDIREKLMELVPTYKPAKN